MQIEHTSWDAMKDLKDYMNNILQFYLTFKILLSKQGSRCGIPRVLTLFRYFKVDKNQNDLKLKLHTLFLHSNEILKNIGFDLLNVGQTLVFF